MFAEDDFPLSLLCGTAFDLVLASLVIDAMMRGVQIYSRDLL